MGTFQGWDKNFERFFIGLDQDNTKEYFYTHRELYRRAVREPAEALVATLTPRYGKGRIFRQNRDTRFSADKRPYHTNIGVEFADSDAHYYMSASADELVVSVGVFRPDKEWIDRFRQVVVGPPGGELLKIIDDLEKLGFRICGEELKKTPRGYPNDHANARLLRHRGITANRMWEPTEWLDNPDTLDLIVGTWEQADALNNWLRLHLPG